MREFQGGKQGNGNDATGAGTAAIGPGKRTLTEGLPAAGAGNAAPSSVATPAALQAILAKGDAMTGEEAVIARDALFSLDGDAFSTMLEQALLSTAFLDMMHQTDFAALIDASKDAGGSSDDDKDAGKGTGAVAGKDAGGKTTRKVVVPTTLLKPATNTIPTDFKRANQIYRPHGITIEKGHHLDISEKTTKKLLGADESLDEFTTDKATAEELKLVKQNREKGHITGYWIPAMTSSRGETLDSSLKNLGADRTSVVVSTAARAQDTFAHELGHALGLPHDADANNLMADGSIRNITGKGIDKLTKAQLTTIRKSIYVELGKKAAAKKDGKDAP